MLLLYALAVLLFGGIAYQRLGLRRAPPPPGRLVEVGGHRLHVRCAGAGDPLVLLEAAIAGSSLSWTLVQREVAAQTEVCAYDRAGLGWSDPPSRPRTVASMLDDLAALVAREAARRPLVLVGHSFGSLLVRAYAARHPDRVAGTVLVDPPTEWLPLTPARLRMLRGGRHFSRLGALLAHMGVVRLCLALAAGGAPGAPRRFVRVFGSSVAQTIERMVGEVRKLPPEIHPLVQAHWCQPKSFRALGAYMRAFEREAAALFAMDPPAGIPVVVISSGAQPTEQMAAHVALAARSVGGRHLIATKSRHWIQFDEPEVIVEAVEHLVRAARQADRGGSS